MDFKHRAFFHCGNGGYFVLAAESDCADDAMVQQPEHHCGVKTLRPWLPLNALGSPSYTQAPRHISTFFSIQERILFLTRFDVSNQKKHFVTPSLWTDACFYWGLGARDASVKRVHVYSNYSYWKNSLKRYIIQCIYLFIIFYLHHRMPAKTKSEQNSVFASKYSFLCFAETDILYL